MPRTGPPFPPRCQAPAVSSARQIRRCLALLWAPRTLQPRGTALLRLKPSFLISPLPFPPLWWASGFGWECGYALLPHGDRKGHRLALGEPRAGGLERGVRWEGRGLVGCWPGVRKAGVVAAFSRLGLLGQPYWEDDLTNPLGAKSSCWKAPSDSPGSFQGD